MANCSLCTGAQLHAPSFPDDVQQLSSIPASTWLLTLGAALVVGSTGVLPLILFPKNSSLKNGLNPKFLNLLLSFAVGGLLGDVFLHLLPETKAQMYTVSRSSASLSPHDVETKMGLLVIGGMIAFLVAEKIMMMYSADEDDEAAGDLSHGHSNGALAASNDSSLRRRPIHTNGHSSTQATTSPTSDEDTDTVEKISPAGYLNLFANIIDNFTHGLAVAASFLAGHKIGVLTTFAIIVHEVPHEVGDFAILLQSGFNRWSAAKAQLSTASGALFGAFAGLVLRNAGESILWVLPFTGGGFLYIAMVTVLPILLKEKDKFQSLLQVSMIVFGVVLMQVMDIGSHWYASVCLSVCLSICLSVCVGLRRLIFAGLNVLQ